jgi:hypothetical protein
MPHEIATREEAVNGLVWKRVILEVHLWGNTLLNLYSVDGDLVFDDGIGGPDVVCRW